MDSIKTNIAVVENIFMETLSIFDNDHTIDSLIEELNRYPYIYRSIAYESASYKIGTDSLLNKNDLREWNEYCSKSEKCHRNHIFIGLGWSFAKTNLHPEKYLDNQLSSALIHDGMGYYYALFKGRNTVKKGLVPDDISDNYVSSFLAGVGRRLWYVSKGNLDRLASFLAEFDSNHHQYLWFGIGIASTYVGGISRECVVQLINRSANKKPSFIKGVVLGVNARKNVNYHTEEMSLISELVLNKNTDEVLNLIRNDSDLLKYYF